VWMLSAGQRPRFVPLAWVGRRPEAQSCGSGGLLSAGVGGLEGRRQSEGWAFLREMRVSVSRWSCMRRYA
jgi:hypothetical protein